jgi:hypothetical protein
VVKAIVLSGGAPRATLTVASYTAPRAPRPRAPSRLNLKRRGETVLVSWRGGRTEHVVRVSESTGARTQLVTKRGKRGLTLAGVPRAVRLTVTVQALAPGGARSATRRAKLR